MPISTPIDADARARTLLPLAALNGVAVSSLYWGQAVVARAVQEFGPSTTISFMPGAALAGYAAGVAALALHAGDLTAPAGLARHAGLLAAALCLAAAAPSAGVLTCACLLIGVGCALTQRVLACATSAVGPERRAQTIGWIIASGLCGIVLARSFVPAAAARLGWRGVFWVDAALVAVCGVTAVTLAAGVHARERVDAGARGGGVALWRGEPELRRAALQQGAVFAAFNMGWAIFPRVLAGAGSAPAAMAAVATLGALAALAAGRLCARWPAASVARAGSVAVGAAAVALVFARPVPAWFCVGMAVLDVGTQIALVANHARAQALVSAPVMRGRVAAVVTTVGFIGGAIGAAVGNLMAWSIGA